MDVLGKISLGSRWDLLAHSPFSSSAPSSSVLVRKSDRWGVCTQGNSTGLSMTPITIMILFHAEIVLFLAIWILFKAALHSLNIA